MKPNVDIVDLIAVQELADYTNPLSLDDYISWWQKGTLLGKKIKCDTFVQFISSQLMGLSIRPERVYRIGTSLPPGATLSADRKTIYDPYLDGEVFEVNKRGWELLMKGIEWDNDVINPVGNVAGGFRLLPTINGQDIFSDGDIVILTFQQQFSPYIPGIDAIARFSNGERIFTTNSTITAGDFRKIFRVRSATNSISINLPLASSYPDNVLLTIVSDGGLQKQVSLNCAGSDNVFWDGLNWPTFFIGRGDSLNLIKSSGGWAVAYWSGSERYNKMGTVEAVYAHGPNQFPLTTNNQVNRADYPGFFDWIKKLAISSPSLVVSNSSWLTNKLKFGLGDGDLITGTTFNFPNWNGRFIRNIDTEGLTDTIRGINTIPASLQEDGNARHRHDYTRVVGGPDGNANFLGGGNFDASFSTYQTAYSGDEARPKNGTLIYVINY